MSLAENTNEKNGWGVSWVAMAIGPEGGPFIACSHGNGTTDAGTLRVTIASDSTGQVQIVAGTAVIGHVIADAGSVVALNPATSGGWSISRTLSANNTTGISAKGSAGQVGGWYITNTNASPRFLKLYNKATAPTVGTDTPVLTILIPGNANGAGANVEFANGIAFATGIGYGITTGVADNDTGAPAANEVVINLLYK